MLSNPLARNRAECRKETFVVIVGFMRAPTYRGRWSCVSGRKTSPLGQRLRTIPLGALEQISELFVLADGFRSSWNFGPAPGVGIPGQLSCNCAGAWAALGMPTGSGLVPCPALGRFRFQLLSRILQVPMPRLANFLRQLLCSRPWAGTEIAQGYVGACFFCFFHVKRFSSLGPRPAFRDTATPDFRHPCNEHSCFKATERQSIA